MGIPLLEIINFLYTYIFLMAFKEYNSVTMTMRKNNENKIHFKKN